MELLLNYLWGVIAVAALGVFHVRPAKDRRRAAALGVLFCSILLLFPAISVSDDLHFQAFVSEDLNASKRLPSVAVRATTVPQGVIFIVVAAFVLAFTCQTLWFVLGAISSRHLSVLVERRVLGRAPPALSLA